MISPEIKDFMFSLYNLLELQDYRNLPSRYRYFYLELSKMIYLIKYKVKNNEAPFYVLTVDQLAKKLGVEIAEPKYRKKKIVSILTKMNGYLKYTNFNFLSSKASMINGLIPFCSHFPKTRCVISMKDSMRL